MEKILSVVQAIREKTDFVPQVALILGSGLGAFYEKMDIRAEIPYAALAGFPVSTVEGHRGRFLFGFIEGVPAVLMQGRVHYYEGYTMEDVVLPIRVMYMLGARTLILTNAAGGIGKAQTPGSLMLISDHITSFVPSPLRGENKAALGERFPDMSEVYDARLRLAVKEIAEKEGISLSEGVYLQAAGPNYETPAEIRAFKTLGADAVGMSTACEAMAAKHMGMRILGISCISNFAAGLSDTPLSHTEVQTAANAAFGQFSALLLGIFRKLREETA